jgi:hypothetical protein
MKKQFYLIFLIDLILLTNCSTTKYVYDESSNQRQKELIHVRSGAVTGEIFLATFSVLLSAVSGTELDYYPSETRFKKIQLQNPTNDTVYVNMLTDVYRDKLDYCDFMDIRIPPGKSCRMLCPVNAEYNVYFRNKWENEEDEMITINTAGLSSVKLVPASTLTSQSK